MRLQARWLGRVWRCVAGLGVMLLALAGAVSTAQADPTDVLPGFPFHASLDEGNAYAASPGWGFEGPCGLAVDPLGDFYVSDYYFGAVDVFEPERRFLGQLRQGDSLDGPCGIDVGASGSLYVNDFHRSVAKYVPEEFPFSSFISYGKTSVGTLFDSEHSTGVAVDPGSGNVYVDDRTYVAVYDSSGAPIEEGGEPLRIGLGSLEDGYGAAVSGYPGTAGYVYVPDAGDDTVKVFDPTVDPENPVQVIDGHETGEGGFISLRDAAVAVDRVRGTVYVVDDLQPEYYERPEAIVYGFASAGAYAGHLKHELIDALPPGLAVDNSAKATQGRVYATSGNTEGAAVYAYGPSALTFSAALPAQGFAGPVGSSNGSNESSAESAVAGPAGTSTAAPAGPPAHASEVAQQGEIRVKVAGKLSPSALPRSGEAPISVFFGGHISTADGSALPQLKRLRIELNRHGRLDYRGLPACPAKKIQPASTARALAACRSSLVGSGSFRANIVLAGQAPYPTKGKLLVFIGRRHAHPVLLGQIYAPYPFATSFVIPFAIHRISSGNYGTALTASLPQALGTWGYVTAIQMKLGRRFAYHGRRHSFISAGCPAPNGFPGAVFNLARASFGFDGGTTVTSTLSRSCDVRPGP